MVAALKPLALAFGLTFGVAGLGRLLTRSVEDASNLEAALTGLKSIVEGTNNSWSRAQQFISDYIADGLVPATDAIQSYKNLLLRGYNTDEVEQVLDILKDTAAFGRQGRLTIGQAIRSGTEGLKNELSILVDNAGITKNLVLMWKDYAAQIGTTVGQLTKQQKIQAEINGLMEESRHMIGDAAKLTNTYQGKVSALSVSFYTLRVAIGNAIIPILSAIIPYIKSAIDALTVFFNRLATIVGSLFGVDIGAARDSMEDTAAATESA
ncbi:MAG: hypothetical protein MI802_26085, partial [Desulfobacterales bacterium]|nr:hypothetical protein [Desulfobacterales bacterium]